MSLEPIDIKFVVKGNVDKEIDKIKRSVNGIDTTTKQAAGKANQNLSGIGKGGGKIGKQFSAGFAKYLNPTTLGISAISGTLIKIGKDAYQFSKEFESAMLEVKTISSLSGEAFENMSDQLLRMSTMPIKDDAQGLSKAMYQIVSAGYDGAEGLAVLEASAKAATGGVTSTMTAADGLTTVMNAWGASVSEVDSISDKMFTTVRLGKTTMEELSSNIAKVAPLASSLGVSFDEVFAATASITKQGTPTAEAFTQMRAALTAMNNVLGDGWAETMTFQEGLAKVRDMAGGSQQELKRLLGTDEAVLATLALTGEKAAGAAADLEAMGSSAGAASAAFEEMSQDVDIKWDQVSKKWKAMLDGTGDTLVQASSALADFLNAALTSVDGLGDEFDEIGEKVNGFSERMKVLRNEGVGVFGSMIHAATSSDEDVQKIVDKEKAQIQMTKDDIAAIQEEYSKLEKSGASDEELKEWKEDLKERYAGMVEDTLKEQEEAENKLKKAKLLGVATLGISSTVTDLKRAEVKDKKDEVGRFQEIFSAVETLGVKTENVVSDTIDDLDEDTKGVIQRLVEELKELKDKTGTFTNPEQEASNLQAIVDKTKEVENAWQRVRDVVEKSNNMDGDNVAMKSRSDNVTLGYDPKPLDMSLAPMKKLTKEEEKQLKLAREKHNIQTATDISNESNAESMMELSDLMYDTSMIMGSFGELAGTFNGELGESAATMAEMAGEASNLAMSLASGDYVGAVVSGLQLLGTAMEEAMGDEEEKNRLALEYNEILKRRIDLLLEAEMIDNSEASARQLKALEDEYDLLLEKMGDLRVDVKHTGPGFGYSDIKFGEILGKKYGDNWGLDELLNFSENYNSILEEIFGTQWIGGFKKINQESINEIEEVIAAMLEVEVAIQDLNESASEFTLGFRNDELKDGLVNGILDGFMLAEDGLGDFADNFNGLMQKAALNAMNSAFDKNHLKSLYDKFEAAMQNDGVITNDEMQALQTDYTDAVKLMQEKAQAWAHVIGEQTEEVEKAEGLKGDIKGITQEQAGMLEGRINAMHMKLIDLGDIQARQLTALYAIETNTNTLVPMSEDIDALRQLQVTNNAILKTIADKETNGGVTI